MCNDSSYNCILLCEFDTYAKGYKNQKSILQCWTTMPIKQYHFTNQVLISFSKGHSRTLTLSFSICFHGYKYILWSNHALQMLEYKDDTEYKYIKLKIYYDLVNENMTNNNQFIDNECKSFVKEIEDNSHFNRLKNSISL